MDPHAAPTLRRPRCARCDRPLAACLCHRVVTVANRVPVLVLQHPLEAGHAKGTVPLLRLSLAHCRVEVGEQFDAGELRSWMGERPVLLYPDTGSSSSVSSSFSSAPVAALPRAAPGCLVVIDATWRKSRLMLHRNPLLQQLPRWSLEAPPASRYGMRRAHRDGQRSTLEATVHALADIEGRAPAHEALLAALDGLVNDWSDRLPMRTTST